MEGARTSSTRGVTTQFENCKLADARTEGNEQWKHSDILTSITNRPRSKDQKDYRRACKIEKAHIIERSLQGLKSTRRAQSEDKKRAFGGHEYNRNYQHAMGLPLKIIITTKPVKMQEKNQGGEEKPKSRNHMDPQRKL
jgi:hypothetical protein